MKRICVVGTGYVGLVTGACFAELGHRVSCVDIDQFKVACLSQGEIPFYEPELKEIVHQNMTASRLSVTSSFAEAVKGADFVFMCVGTPPMGNDQVDLSYLHLAYINIKVVLSGKRCIIVNKSTVPPGTSDMMEFILSRQCNGAGSPRVVANPEFLREGNAVYDFMHPSRVVIGANDQAAATAVAELYRPLDCPVLITDPRTAEMIKYVSNAFLATKISFINEIANICDKIGVNVDDVAEGIGLDPRIGKEFLKAGIGYGGSCLPKDTAVLGRLARASGQVPALLNAVIEVNSQQPHYLIERVKGALQTLAGSKLAVLGLSFKAHTDDTRCSPAITLIKALQSQGAEVTAYDPQPLLKTGVLPDQVKCAQDPYEAARGCEAVIVATDWPEFKDLDLPRLKAVMRGHVLADGRNILDPDRVKQAGFLYIGVGRGREASFPLPSSPNWVAVLLD